MNLKEWALILFTILTQMSVGSFVILRIVHFYAAQKKGMETADRLSDKALLALIPMLALATLISLLHLGNPLRAPYALVNVTNSWLSREILFTVIFGGFAFIFVLLQYLKIGTSQIRNLIGWIASIAGLVLIYCMSSVYMIPTQPAWNTAATPISFYTTTFLLGSLAVAVACIVNYSSESRKNPKSANELCEVLYGALKGIAIFSIILLGVEFIVQPLYLGYLATAGATAQASASAIVNDFRSVFVLRLLLVFLGAGLFGVFLYKNTAINGSEALVKTLGYSAFSLVLVAEVLGRFLFYFSKLRIGV